MIPEATLTAILLIVFLADLFTVRVRCAAGSIRWYAY